MARSLSGRGEKTLGIDAVPTESGRLAPVQEEHRPPEAQGPESRGPASPRKKELASGSGAQTNQSTGSDGNLPPPLKEFLAFLQSQPDGGIKISSEQAPAVAAFLLSAGLPQEEVDRLVFGAGSGEKTLSAADLIAAWQRLQSLKSSTTPEVTRQSTPQAAERADLTPQAQQIRQSSEYKEQWQRLTVPPDMVSRLRLALAHLGVSPEELARFDEKAQNGGISLSQVWQLLRQSQQKTASENPGASLQTGAGEPLSQSIMEEIFPVSRDELAEWQQVLLEAGFQPAWLEKLLGQSATGSRQELRNSLLALTPPEEKPVLNDPKPLYFPWDLRQRTFSLDGWTQGNRSQLEEETRNQQAWPGLKAAASHQTSDLEEGLGLSPFSATLQAVEPRVAASSALVREALPSWPWLSPELRESIWGQLQSGIVENLSPGESRVNLNLNPPELGQIQLTLHLSGKELAVTAVATRPEVAELATQGVQQLLQSLAQQGLVLTNFQVLVQEPGLTPATAVFTGAKENHGGEVEKKFPSPSRRRSLEVDRFV
ncbi:MAG: flagellar hook-length control protein FliK [Desulfobaccales bacterium]